MELISRENEIFDILQKFIEAGLEFIVVGGYAVSAFKHRFSVDADIVISKRDLEKFEEILRRENFKRTIIKELENIYSSKFIRYEKDKAFVDLLIDALASRTTNAAFSFELLMKNSVKKKIIGIEKEITARIPIKELLIAIKIHSGRLTDFRDIAAVAKNTNLNLIKKFLFIGKIKEVDKNLKGLNLAVRSRNFIDSFKGVFLEKKFDIDFKQVERISRLR